MWLSARTTKPSPTSTMFTHAGACSRPPSEDALAGQGSETIARLTAPWSTASSVSQSSSASRRSRAGRTRSRREPIVSPPRKRVSCGTTPSNDAGERALELVLRDVGEPAALELAQLRPGLGLVRRRDDAGRLERARQPARDHAVEGDPGEGVARGAGLLDARGRERDRPRVAPGGRARRNRPRRRGA